MSLWLIYKHVVTRGEGGIWRAARGKVSSVGSGLTRGRPQRRHQRGPWPSGRGGLLSGSNTTLGLACSAPPPRQTSDPGRCKEPPEPRHTAAARATGGAHLGERHPGDGHRGRGGRGTCSRRSDLGIRGAQLLGAPQWAQSRRGRLVRPSTRLRAGRWGA